MMTGALPRLRQSSRITRDFVIGFGASEAEARAAADGSFATGLDEVLARFNGEGERVGWEDYVGSLTELPRIAEQATDGGKLAYASALMLKVQEDRTHAGALIASLSNPWGDTVDASKSSTGYKAVWPRDFYQVAMALAAPGRQGDAAGGLQLSAPGPGRPEHAGQHRRRRLVPAEDARRWRTGVGRGPAGPDRHADHAGLSSVEDGLAVRRPDDRTLLGPC
jgi:hypothetical protein